MRPAAERPGPSVPCGVLLLDKPIGLSSNAALQRVRRLLGGVKAGHAGSLDPLASGMLPICLGEATKLAGELLAGDKAYSFRIVLGTRTATGDAEGEVIERLPVPDLDGARIEAVLTARAGESLQVPPMHSALKHRGEPLYRLARRGETVERTPRRISIHSLRLIGRGPDWLDLEVVCSKGTYVRVLAEELAGALGTCGHVGTLRRAYVEPFQGQPMITLEELARRSSERGWLLPPDAALPRFPVVMLDTTAAAALRQGRTIATPEAGPAGTVRLRDEHGRFIGLGERDAAGGLKARRLFAP